MRLPGLALMLAMPFTATGAGTQQGAQCVPINPPKPDVDFVYSYTSSTGEAHESTVRWFEFTPTTSKLRTTRTTAAGSWVATEDTRHSVENDLLLMLVDNVTGTDEAGPFSSSMTYSPGMIVMPAFRACAGQTVTIPSVAQTTKSNQRITSAQSDAGELKVIGVDVPVTVPAGTFSTVQFTRTLNKPRGTDVTEVWRTTLHGVTVKRVHTTPRTKATEVLQAIR